MDIAYMEYKLGELKQKLYKLTETKEVEDYEVKNLDVYFNTTTMTRGSKEEIAHVKHEIEKLEKEIQEAKKHKIQRENEEKDREYREKREAEERKKKEVAKAKQEAELEKDITEIHRKDQKRSFRLVKDMYRKGPFVYRVLDKVIPFRGPKWKVIKGYTKEELEFLVKIAKGETLYQEKQEREYERHHIEFNKKDRMWSNWNAFMAALESKYKLKSKIERDQEMKENPYGIR